MYFVQAGLLLLEPIEVLTPPSTRCWTCWLTGAWQTGPMPGQTLIIPATQSTQQVDNGSMKGWHVILSCRSLWFPAHPASLHGPHPLSHPEEGGLPHRGPPCQRGGSGHGRCVLRDAGQQKPEHFHESCTNPVLLPRLKVI